MVDMAYPAQFRKKLFSVKEKEGLTALECAKRFGVSKGSVLRWENDQDPIFKRNRPAQKIDMLALAKDVEENPDSYHYERAARFNVTEGGIRAALKRLNISCKKKSEASQSK